MDTKDWWEGFFLGVSITCCVILVTLKVIRFDMSYLVALDGMKVESIVDYTSRGECLEQLELLMKAGPNKLVWQCVDNNS